ncbi:MAG: hypothetical protein ACREB9_02835 [Thermoplasmata archaeon]
MSLPEFLPRLRGWTYHSVVLGNPAQQAAFSVQPNKPIILLPEGSSGWFIDAILAINSAYGTVNLLIDKIKTVVTPHSLGATGQTGPHAGIFTNVSTQLPLAEAPQYGPLSTIVYEAVTAKPFKDNVQIYFTETKGVTVVGLEVNVALILDEEEFDLSYQELIGVRPHKPRLTRLAIKKVGGESPTGSD